MDVVLHEPSGFTMILHWCNFELINNAQHSNEITDLILYNLDHPFLARCEYCIKSDFKMSFIYEYFPLKLSTLLKKLHTMKSFTEESSQNLFIAIGQYFGAQLLLLTEYIHSKGLVLGQNFQIDNLFVDSEGKLATKIS
jgi:hypothetical protein